MILPCNDQGQAQDEDRNVGGELPAKHMAIGAPSDAISELMPAILMLASMSRGEEDDGDDR